MCEWLSTKFFGRRQSKMRPEIERYGLALRSVPFPYSAMLAICSDLDETASLDCYLQSSKFLNTEATTRFGKGVGLETGNTMYFHMPEGELSYWGTTDEGRAAIRALIRSGHIDCLHSFGDSALNRQQVKQCLAELERHECRIEVWIDHAVAASNFGADIMRGQGDLRDEDIYHADLTLAHGVKFLSRGRVTSMIGQDARKSLRGIVSWGHPLLSVKTLVKEAVKIVLGTLGHKKYVMHGSNKLLRSVTLRDGQSAIEFLRANPHPLGVDQGENAFGLGEVVTRRFLDRLAARQAKCVLYTHLGKRIDENKGFPEHTVEALRELKRRNETGEILVTTTQRVLNYAQMMEGVSWQVETTPDGLDLFLDARGTSDFQGLSLESPSETRVRLFVGGERVPLQSDECPLRAGRIVWYIPWRKLAYPL